MANWWQDEPSWWCQRWESVFDHQQKCALMKIIIIDRNRIEKCLKLEIFCFFLLRAPIHQKYKRSENIFTTIYFRRLDRKDFELSALKISAINEQFTSRVRNGGVDLDLDNQGSSKDVKDNKSTWLQTAPSNKLRCDVWWTRFEEQRRVGETWVKFFLKSSTNLEKPGKNAFHL